ncbi:MAG TPA: hypothetical protein VEX64_08140 [Pyrinomonadaceae bacterium]|jgi:hypothetical protein|nr:hypothetical protein [Pyrinomonadaceae bacterium]
MVKRTEHGEQRHEEKERPTSEADKDKAGSSEIYLDIETGYYVFVGGKGRTHVFTSENSHHTSFRTTQRNRIEREESGKWERIERGDLPDKLK